MDKPKWPSIAVHRGIDGAEITITISEEVTEMTDPGDPVQRANQAYLHRSEAARLVDALKMALPGGTLDMLLVELLEDKKSRLLVPITPADVPRPDRNPEDA